MRTCGRPRRGVSEACADASGNTVTMADETLLNTEPSLKETYLVRSRSLAPLSRPEGAQKLGLAVRPHA
jgi:hypothetical protein